VVDQALKMAGVQRKDISAVAFTRGPGLLGSLLVGVSFAKGLSLSLDIPMIEVNHLNGHILAHFIREKDKSSDMPAFPFLCLLVSGGHTQILVVKDFLETETLGRTIDDAAGEAFDKCAKIMGLPYPGGPEIDKLAETGNPKAFHFPKPGVAELDFSFSGLKTAFLYFLRDKLAVDPDFVEKNKNDLCASIQHTIVEILLDKLHIACRKTGIHEIAIGGGVAANSYLKNQALGWAKKYKRKVFIPERRFTTDNAAMIATAGYYKFLKKEFAEHDVTPLARYDL
jgi:N6-L-threonylcarbamoyladenine synthase